MPDSSELLLLFAEHKDALRGILFRMVPSSEVDDLLQEVFLKSLRAWPAFRGDAEAGTWLYQIARNAALDHLKSRSHRERQKTDPLPEPDASVDWRHLSAAIAEQPEAARRLEAHEMHSCIRDYVKRLAPEQRQVIELKDLEGWTNARIAEHLGISVDAAKIRLHRARIALRQELAKGCDFYQNEGGNLACDQRRDSSVSVDALISSKDAQCKADAECTDLAELTTNNPNPMSSESSCGCSNPNDCGSAGPSNSLFTPIAAEFVAIGAAIGANCEPCLRYHIGEAQKLGISPDDIARAVAMAEKIKETPARTILKLAERLTKTDSKESGESAPRCGCSSQ